MKAQATLTAYIQQSLRDNWDRVAMSDFRGQQFTFRDIARKIAKLHLLFEHAGLQPGDMVALCARNSSQWAIAALASLTYGTVTVPILHDFKPDTLHHLLRHSDARLLFTEPALWEELDHENVPALKGVIDISDYSLMFSRSKRLEHARAELNKLFGEKYPERFTAADVSYPEFDADRMALVNYTSGSMGFSKGVMLTYGNLWSNIQYTIDGLKFLLPGDGTLCMLPLAHMFGFTIEMLHPFVKGCHIYYITRTPSPKIVIEAFKEVQPKLIIAVPLILEKIVKTRVFPLLDKPLMKIMMHIPFVDSHLLNKIKEKLTEAFGDKVQEIIIGGAGLNKDVETFLDRIEFPFTVGYGMTECAPLISYAPWHSRKKGSCGRIVDRMELRIDSPDPEHQPGVVWVRGANVMKGYYKNEEATKAIFDSDGWMNTGDIASIDAEGNLFIRGRDKNMILGPSGQNIYPEEIEQLLNNLPYVAESLIVERDGKITALVHPDYDTASKAGLDEKQLLKQLDDNIEALNAELPVFSQVRDMKIFRDEFEKTPKRSIRRYLYN